VAENLSVRDVEESVRARTELDESSAPNAGGSGSGPTVRKLRAPGLLELEELFSQYLDTKVQVTMGPRRGKVVIDFADLEDLERIYRAIIAP